MHQNSPFPKPEDSPKIEYVHSVPHALGTRAVGGSMIFYENGESETLDGLGSLVNEGFRKLFGVLKNVFGVRVEKVATPPNLSNQVTDILPIAPNEPIE